MKKIVMKQNDTLPYFRAQLRDAQGPVSVADSQVKLHILRQNKKDVIINTEVDIIDAELGIVEYRWKKQDTEDTGLYFGEIEVTYPNEEIITFPNDGYFKLQIVGELI